MNRRSFFTGLATLAVWPMAIRPRMRRDLRVFTPILDNPIAPAPVMFPGLPPGGFGPFEFRSIAGKMFEMIDGEWVEI